MDLNDVAVIVGPGAEGGLGPGAADIGVIESGVSEEGLIGGKQHPGGCRIIRLRIAFVGNGHGSFAENSSAAGADRLQIQIAVGNMQGQNSVRFEMPEVDGERFAGEQMDGNGIVLENASSWREDPAGGSPDRSMVRRASPIRMRLSAGECG